MNGESTEIYYGYEEYAESASLSRDLIMFYQIQAGAVLEKYGRSFMDFTRGLESLVALGNRKISTYEATGYNIILDENDAPFISDEPLIFYNNYVGRIEHFGILLAEMEQRCIITPEQVVFGIKASRVIWDENWKIDPDDEYVDELERTLWDVDRIGIDESGEEVLFGMVTTKHQTTQTVELVVAFKPRIYGGQASIDQNVFDIVDFLEENANSETENDKYIPGSWAYPDTRATISLKEILEQERGENTTNFQEVRANIYRRIGGKEQLLVARERTRFRQRWSPHWIEMNEKLASYLSESGVLP